MKAFGKMLRKPGWLAVLLCAGIILPSFSGLSLAADPDNGDGLCEHHPAHTLECGYAAPAEEIPCAHVHDGACGYVPAREEIPCDRNCGTQDAPAPEDPPETDAAPDGAAHDPDCAYRPAEAETPCIHTHDAACGYAPATEGRPCGFVCLACRDGEGPQSAEIQSWSWEDPEGLLVYAPETGCWGLGVPGASADSPLMPEALAELLPGAAVLTLDGGAQETVTLTWDLSAIPAEGAASGSYVLTAALPEGYALGPGAPALEVLVEIGGGEGYDLTPWAFNNWKWEHYGKPDVAVLYVGIDGIQSADELAVLLKKNLPKEIYVNVWSDRGSAFYVAETATTGWLKVFWNDLETQLQNIDWHNTFQVYATPPTDDKYDYIVNDDAKPAPNRMERLPITICPCFLSDHIVTPVEPENVTVNLFDYWVQTDGAAGDDLLPKTDIHVNNKSEEVKRTGVDDWNHGINAGRLFLFGDGNIHAGFWNKGAGAVTSYGKENAGMPGIVEPVLQSGYPVINTADMTNLMDGEAKTYQGITDWELCGDHIGLPDDTQHDSSNYQNISNTVINLWKESGNTASLDYLFTPEDGDYKRTYPDVEGLFQLDAHGYYYYDMRRNYAEYDQESNKFVLYDAPAVDRTDGLYDDAADDWTKTRSTGNFFPFNPASEVFTGVKDGKLISSTAVQSDNKLNKSARPMNHHLGMTVEIDFLQPAGGKIKMGADAPVPMTFQFSGDDDVWIFIDDVLVLDLGGVHSEIFGTIDFSNGKVSVGQSWKTNGFPYNEDGTVNVGKLEENSILNTTLKQLFADAGREDHTTWTGNTFASNTDHTLKMFYLERGNYDSSLALRFNLQPLLDQELKKVNQDGEPVPDVSFDLYAAEDAGNGMYAVHPKFPNAFATLTTGPDGTVKFLEPEENAGGRSEGELKNREGRPFNFADRYTTDGIRYYILKEVRTPAGYRPVPVDVVLEYHPETTTLTVANRWTTGGVSSFTTHISGSTNITYGQFDNEHGNISAGNVKVDPEDQKNGLVIAVPMTWVEGESRWKALYGSNTTGFQTVTPEKREAKFWRKALLTAALYQCADENTPSWYLEWNDETRRLEGVLADLPGMASQYQFNNPAGADMKLVYAIIDPVALVKLGVIDASAGESGSADGGIPAESERYAKLRGYINAQVQSGKSLDAVVKETVEIIYGTVEDTEDAESSNGANGRGVSFLNVGQFTQNARSLLYIPNEQRELRVWKVDQNGRGVNGAEFWLYDNPDCTGDPVASGTTGTIDGRDGVLIFAPYVEPAPGQVQFAWASHEHENTKNYWLQERTPPAGHTLNPTKIPVVVGTYSIYADAGAENDGVSVMAGVGKLVQTMLRFAANEELDITLRDITAFAQHQASGSYRSNNWADLPMEGTGTPGIPWSMNLHYGKAHGTTQGFGEYLNYGLHAEDGGANIYPFFTADTGYLRARVEQNYPALTGNLYEGSQSTANKIDLGDTNITSQKTMQN